MKYTIRRGRISVHHAIEFLSIVVEIQISLCVNISKNIKYSCYRISNYLKKSFKNSRKYISIYECFVSFHYSVYSTTQYTFDNSNLDKITQICQILGSRTIIQIVNTTIWYSYIKLHNLTRIEIKNCSISVIFIWSWNKLLIINNIWYILRVCVLRWYNTAIKIFNMKSTSTVNL